MSENSRCQSGVGRKLLSAEAGEVRSLPGEWSCLQVSGEGGHIAPVRRRTMEAQTESNQEKEGTGGRTLETTGMRVR